MTTPIANSLRAAKHQIMLYQVGHYGVGEQTQMLADMYGINWEEFKKEHSEEITYLVLKHED